MWDLDQIIQQNNQAALDYMMKTQKVVEAQAPHPETWPLSLLAEKMGAGPPLLGELMNCFANTSVIYGFVKLIREYLPEHEAEIMSQKPRSRRFYRFCHLFNKRYFPLPGEVDGDLEAFVNYLPVWLMAMSYSAYHNLEMRPGYLLLLSLVIYPYEGDDREMLEEDDLHDVNTGGRIPLLDVVQQLVGAELVERIPAEGWSPSDLHSMTDKTKYDGVGHFADWACSDTGCVVLDNSYDDCDYMEGYGEPLFKWTRQNVELLTEQWPKVKQIRKKIDSIVDWLEKDPIANFQELLEVLLSKPVPKKKRRMRDHNPVPLEQIGEEEDFGDGEENG